MNLSWRYARISMSQEMAPRARKFGSRSSMLSYLISSMSRYSFPDSLGGIERGKKLNDLCCSSETTYHPLCLYSFKFSKLPLCFFLPLDSVFFILLSLFSLFFSLQLLIPSSSNIQLNKKTKTQTQTLGTLISEQLFVCLDP